MVIFRSLPPSPFAALPGGVFATVSNQRVVSCCSRSASTPRSTPHSRLCSSPYSSPRRSPHSSPSVTGPPKLPGSRSSAPRTAAAARSSIARTCTVIGASSTVPRPLERRGERGVIRGGRGQVRSRVRLFANYRSDERSATTTEGDGWSVTTTGDERSVKEMGGALRLQEMRGVLRRWVECYNYRRRWEERYDYRR